MFDRNRISIHAFMFGIACSASVYLNVFVCAHVDIVNMYYQGYKIVRHEQQQQQVVRNTITGKSCSHGTCNFGGS